MEEKAQSDFIDFEVTSFYSDNEICLVEIQISLSGELWSEFEKSPKYQKLVDYVESLQTRCRQAEHDGQEYRGGNAAL